MNVRRGGVAVPSLAAGVGLALSLPPFGLWPLAFLGAAVLYWRLAGLGPSTRLWAGWLAGLGCFVPGLFSLRSFNWYGAAVLMVVEALSMAVAALLVSPTRWRVPTFVGAFTLLEAVRMTWPFGGLPIGGIFLGQADGPLLAAARLGGPLLLTALVWLGGAGLSELSTGYRARFGARAATAPTTRERPGAVPSALRGAAALALVVVLGALSFFSPDGGAQIRALRTAVVQGGGRRGFSKEGVNPDSVFSAQLAATNAMKRTDGGRTPPLVLWPEDVISLSGRLAGSPQAALMSRLARRLHTTLVAGVTETVSDSAFRNEIVAWGPSGRIAAVYEKVHRVPFGEYVQYRSFFAHFANLSAVHLDAVPGHGSGLMRTPAAPLGVLVSYEVFYADRSRPSVTAGAQLLIVPTNTSSYATAQVPAQEVAADRVQATEMGRDLLQAAPTGYSTVVDHDGTVLVQSALGPPAVLFATVGLRSGTTFYAATGDALILLVSALALVAGWVADRPWRPRRRKTGRAAGEGPGHRGEGDPVSDRSPASALPSRAQS